MAVVDFPPLFCHLREFVDLLGSPAEDFFFDTVDNSSEIWTVYFQELFLVCDVQ